MNFHPILGKSGLEISMSSTGPSSLKLISGWLIETIWQKKSSTQVRIAQLRLCWIGLAQSGLAQPGLAQKRLSYGFRIRLTIQLMMFLYQNIGKIAKMWSYIYDIGEKLSSCEQIQEQKKWSISFHRNEAQPSSCGKIQTIC